jgi:antitoxin ParD1/3/4
MRVTLSRDLQRFVEEKMRTGGYSKPGEVVRDALLAMQAQDDLTPDEIVELRREVMIGVRQAERGEFVEFTAADVDAEGRRILAARKAQGRRAAERRRAS